MAKKPAKDFDVDKKFAAQPYSDTEQIVVVGSGEYSDFGIDDLMIGPKSLNVESSWLTFRRDNLGHMPYGNRGWRSTGLSGVSFYEFLKNAGFRRIVFTEASCDE